MPNEDDQKSQEPDSRLSKTMQRDFDGGYGLFTDCLNQWGSILTWLEGGAEEARKYVRRAAEIIYQKNKAYHWPPKINPYP